MNDTLQTASLCPKCHWVRRVESARGSVFLLCGLAGVEPGFPKYPRLPVLECSGFRPEGESPEASTVRVDAGQDTRER